MKNFKYANMIFFGILVLFVLFLALITHDTNVQTSNQLLEFLINNHRTLMFIMAILAGVFGFYMNKELEGKLQNQEQATKEITELWLQTQGQVERRILKQLMIGGDQTQAQLSQLPDMTRVKVHRSIQRLKKQELISVEVIGKVRHVHLADVLKR